MSKWNPSFVRFTSSLFSFHCSQDLKTTFARFSFTALPLHTLQALGLLTQACGRGAVSPPAPMPSHTRTPWCSAMVLLLGAPLFSPRARRSHSFPSFQQHCFFKRQLRLHRLTPRRVPTSLAPVAPGPPPSSRPLSHEPTPRHRLHKHHPYLQLTSLGLWRSFFPRLLLRLPFATIPTENTQGFAADRSLNPHESLQGKCFYHFPQFTTAWSSQPAGSKGNAPSQAPSTLPRHPALRSTSPSPQFTYSTAKRCRDMTLCLTLNSEPQQKRCPLIILQHMCCIMISILCIRPNIHIRKQIPRKSRYYRRQHFWLVLSHTLHSLLWQRSQEGRQHQNSACKCQWASRSCSLQHRDASLVLTTYQPFLIYIY